MKPILQVEDDPNDVFFLNYALKKAGVANPVQIAVDGQQGIDYLAGVGKYADRQLYPMPCLVLLDLKLPYVMGLDVLTWIRLNPQSESLVVIILSASTESTDVASAYQLGANAFLSKPSEANKLEHIVRAIKDFWLTHNLLPPEARMETLTGPRLAKPTASTRKIKKTLNVNGNGRSTIEKPLARNTVAT